MYAYLQTEFNELMSGAVIEVFFSPLEGGKFYCGVEKQEVGVSFGCALVCYPECDSIIQYIHVHTYRCEYSN